MTLSYKPVQTTSLHIRRSVFLQRHAVSSQSQSPNPTTPLGNTISSLDNNNVPYWTILYSVFITWKVKQESRAAREGDIRQTHIATAQLEAMLHVLPSQLYYEWANVLYVVKKTGPLLRWPLCIAYTLNIHLGPNKKEKPVGQLVCRTLMDVWLGLQNCHTF